MRIMFVCTGNICRSPAAHAVCESMIKRAGLSDRIEVASSGTGHWHVGQQADSRMRAAAAEAGYPIDHAAQRITKADLREYDLILAMDHDNYDDILSMTCDPGLRSRVRFFREYDPESLGKKDLDVPDPYYGGPEGFRRVVAMVERTCESLIQQLADHI